MLDDPYRDSGLGCAARLGLFVVLVLALLVRASPMWPGPSIPGATRLELRTAAPSLLPSFGCRAALLSPITIADEGDRLIVRRADTGARIEVVWPANWSAWRLGELVVLLNRHGGVEGVEGEVIEGLGGGMLGNATVGVCVLFG